MLPRRKKRKNETWTTSQSTQILPLPSASTGFCSLTSLPGAHSGPERLDQEQPAQPCPRELSCRTSSVSPGSLLLPPLSPSTPPTYPKTRGAILESDTRERWSAHAFRLKENSRLPHPQPLPLQIPNPLTGGPEPRAARRFPLHSPSHMGHKDERGCCFQRDL